MIDFLENSPANDDLEITGLFSTYLRAELHMEKMCFSNQPQNDALTTSIFLPIIWKRNGNIFVISYCAVSCVIVILALLSHTVFVFLSVL